MAYNFKYKSSNCLSASYSGSSWVIADARYCTHTIKTKSGPRNAHYLVLSFYRENKPESKTPETWKWIRVQISTKSPSSDFNKLHQAIYGTILPRTTLYYDFRKAADGIINDLLSNEVNVRAQFGTDGIGNPCIAAISLIKNKKFHSRPDMQFWHDSVLNTYRAIFTLDECMKIRGGLKIKFNGPAVKQADDDQEILEEDATQPEEIEPEPDEYGEPSNAVDEEEAPSEDDPGQDEELNPLINPEQDEKPEEEPEPIVSQEDIDAFMAMVEEEKKKGWKRPEAP